MYGDSKIALHFYLARVLRACAPKIKKPAHSDKVGLCRVRTTGVSAACAQCARAAHRTSVAHCAHGEKFCAHCAQVKIAEFSGKIHLKYL